MTNPRDYPNTIRISETGRPWLGIEPADPFAEVESLVPLGFKSVFTPARTMRRTGRQRIAGHSRVGRLWPQNCRILYHVVKYVAIPWQGGYKGACPNMAGAGSPASMTGQSGSINSVSGGT
jgi:hypothetical protein